MASRIVWTCIVCGFRAEERPPKHCPTCGVNSAKFRMIVDREPTKIVPEEKPVEDEKKEALAS